MDSVIIHILLLFIQLYDGKIQVDILACHGVSITHELFQIPEISFHIAKLFAERAANFLCRVFSAFCKRKIFFSGTSAVSSGQLESIGFTKPINDIFQFFSCFVQKRDILRITDICGCTGCINSQRSFVCIFFCRIVITGCSCWWWDVVIFFFVLVGKKILVYFHQHFCWNALAEENQRACIKRGFFLKTRKTNKVLQIWILCNLFHELTIRILELCLDDQRP